MSKTWLRAGPLLLALALAICIAAQAPVFSKDSQYYLQAGYLWPEGKVSYSANLIGSRIFAVSYYHLFQRVFGASIDSVCLAMAVLFLIYCCCIALFTATFLQSSFKSALANASLFLVGYVWMDWRLPLTEPFLLVASISALALLRLASISRRGWHEVTISAAIGLCCGVATGFRAELVILIVATFLSLFAAEFSRSNWKRFGLASSALFISFIAGSVTPGLAFKYVSGHPLPPQLTGYFLFYYTVEAFGSPSNGPASAKLDALGKELLSVSPLAVEIKPMRVGLAAEYNQAGAKAASDLFQQAGWEAVKAQPLHVALRTAETLWNYTMAYPGTVGMRWEAKARGIVKVSKRLAAIDQERLYAAKWRFRGDYSWPTASIVDRRLEWVRPLDALNVPVVQLVLPGWFIAVIAIATLIRAAACRAAFIPCFTAILYSGGCLVAAAFTQGFVDRYFIVPSLLVVITSTLTAVSLITKQKTQTEA